ncbi:MAG: hypothetical protein ACI4WW_03475 [Candidatus Coprovivens sp.]
MEAKEVLKKIEEHGFEAYIVGGYVRDYILGLESHDVDICTNAKVKDILDIFGNNLVYSDYYGNVKMISDKYNIDITTYRRDVKYNDDRRQVEIEYVDNLMDDLDRRDFTMNTLCMNIDNTIIDVFNGRQDIENRLIRCVGNAEERIKEDPLRILRAVRFATVLDFKIEEGLYDVLKKNANLLERLSLERIKEELTKILVNKNAIRGLDYLRRLGFLEYLGIEYDKIVNVTDICGMYSQLIIKKDYPFTKEEKELISDIKKIVAYGNIDNDILFEYGLYSSLVAGSILGIKIKDITDMNANMVIQSIKDINISSEEICNILNVEPSKVIRDVYDSLKVQILNGELDNDYDTIKEFINSNREKWLDERSNKGNFIF